MHVSVKEITPCEKVLSVAVTGELIQKEYEEYFEKISRSAKIPGFRPGKAPKEVLRVYFREDAREKVLERLITQTFRQAMGEKQLEFLGRPAISQVEFSDERLRYEARIEVPPKIKLGKYRGFSAVRPTVQVKAEEVEEALEHVRHSLAKIVTAENRAAKMGDYLVADYRCLVQGNEADKRENDWFELREDEYLKGFSSQLAGIQTNEEREVKVKFPENFGRKDWAGKDALFVVKVKEIKEKKLLPLDDELAKEGGEFQTLAELRSHLERQIEDEKSREAEIEFENKLLEALLKEHSFEVPKGFVERRQASLANAAVESLHRRGMDEEAIKKEAESIFEKFRPEAERQVRLSFLLNEIARQEKMELSEQNFEVKYQEIAQRHRETPDAVRKYYSEHPEAKETLAVQILNEKVIQLIKDNAKSGRES